MTSSPLAAYAARNEPRLAAPDSLARKIDALAEAAVQARRDVDRARVEQLVEQISSYANTNGIPNAQLQALLRILIASKSNLDGPKTRVLVKSLVPRERIAAATVLLLIGSLGEGERKAVYATQALLLRWLVMVYDFLGDYAIVHQLYGVLFNLLHTANLRGSACHLLALCTRRKDVKPFRIQALMKLYEDHGDEPAVVGLLQVYRSFYPDIILIGTRKRSSFKLWDPVWVQNVVLIQSREENAQDVGKAGDSQLRLRKGNRITSKARNSIVPTLHTFDASETSVTLEEIDSARDLVNNLQKLELPSQVGAVFRDDMFRNFVLLKDSPAIAIRLDDWTGAALFEELDVEQSSKSPSERLDAFLHHIWDYTAMRKALLPPVVDFLKEYMKSWNGKWHRETILGLLSFVQFSQLNDLQIEYFQKLETLFMNNSPTDVTALIRFHTAYARNVIIQYSTTQNRDQEADIRHALRQYILYVDQLNTQALVTFRTTPAVVSLLHTALEFYDTVVHVPIERPVFDIVYPADVVIYSSVFLGDSVSFSTLCGILAVYKQSFLEQTEVRSRDPKVARYGEPDRAYVDHFNGFLMDISNFFWRFRCFYRDPAKDTNALGCLMRDDFITHLNLAANARELSLNGIFTVTHSATFSRFNAECLRFLEDRHEELKSDLEVRHAGPVTSKSLTGLAGDGGYKIEYRVFKMASLEYLRRKGFDGVYSLIYSTMKKLREEAGKHNVAAMFEGLDEWSSAGSEPMEF
ncbi:hypothetical protein DRE_06654 [Drechslerella stenobrocha 248]|uniref:Mis6 domain-containing protein n=1 Tax=Drechslerella stenobrocha 248 TaxID=1043628 RepID=W7HXD9_9PEZI|nr:hypothetical protein DRE_06654 [Drechslerella stenobrocha 248]